MESAGERSVKYDQLKIQREKGAETPPTLLNNYKITNINKYTYHIHAIL